jgi:hypothetical protein
VGADRCVEWLPQMNDVPIDLLKIEEEKAKFFWG